MATAVVELYAKRADVLGEGPMWSSIEQALYWIDFAKKLLHRQAPGDSDCQSWLLPDHPGCLGEMAAGSVAVTMGEGLYRVDLATGASQLRCEAPPRRPGTLFNDGKVDPRGWFWAGAVKDNFGSNGESVAVDGHFGALYRFDPPLAKALLAFRIDRQWTSMAACGMPGGMVAPFCELRPTGKLIES